jgi:photosystem II stability/assembly factor-like uncharacterized protein
VLHLQLNDYRGLGRTFYSNAQAPTVPANLGIQSISGLNNFARFHVELPVAPKSAPKLPAVASPVGRPSLAKAAAQPETRTGGYWPSDLRSLYDTNGYTCGGSPCDGTGQTLGYTLWGPGVAQGTFNQFHTVTGDTQITVDTTNGTQTGNATTGGTCVGSVAIGPNTGESCVDLQESPNNIIYILENGQQNLATSLAGDGSITEETGMDIESSHGMAPNAAMKYYLADDGASNVGLEQAISDAGSDPTLHTVSNSWGQDGDYESTSDPFYVATTNEMELAAAAGTTFYFSSGDSGSNNEGAPSDNQWDVSVGGTGIYAPGAGNSPTGSNNVFSTELEWGNAGGGSSCSDAVPRPFWQTGISAVADCPGRATPDIALDADPNTGFGVTWSNDHSVAATTSTSWSSSNGGVAIVGVPTATRGSTPVATVGNPVTVSGISSGGPGSYDGTFIVTAATTTTVSYALTTDPGSITNGTSGSSYSGSSVIFVYSTNTQIGGTSLAAPLANGMGALLSSFVAAQTYPGATPQVGFSGPVIYALGNSPNYDHFFRDITCGNNANPAGGPNGDQTGQGWDQATGFGSIDWHNFAVGVAQYLGATNLSTPGRLTQNYPWSCAQYAMNLSVRGLVCPVAGTCYGGGSAASGSFSPALAEAEGWVIRPKSANMQFNKSTNGGVTWEATNPDMYAVACTSDSNCVQVGDEGRIRTTSNGGNSWTQVSGPFKKTLLAVTCPSSSICYAAGDNGTIIKSSDGGNTWSLLPSGIGNTVYALSCPTTTTCYAADYFGLLDETTDGGATWTNSAKSDIYNSGTGLAESLSCPNSTTCYMVGMDLNGVSAPIDVTTNSGATWTPETSGVAGNLNAIQCFSATNCIAVANGGTIIETTDGATWSAMTSNTTASLVGLSCTDANDCYASGTGGTVDVLSGGTWTPATVSAAAGNLLSGISCADTTDCVATGAESMTIATTDGSTWTQQLGGGVPASGTGQAVFAMACPSANECLAVTNTASGNATPYVIRTLDGGQTWVRQTVTGATASLNGISCVSVSVCVAVGSAPSSSAPGSVFVSTNADNAGGSTWAAQTSGTGNNVSLEWVSCQSGGTTVCMAAANNGQVDVNSDVTGVGTWGMATTGNTNALAGIACQSTTQCLAVGTLGTILSTSDGGNTWTSASNPFAGISTLNGVNCSTSNPNQCYAVGNWGTVLASSDGGQTWTQQPTPLSGPLNALNNGGGQNNLLSVACNSNCILGGQQGAILLPGQTVTVSASGTYGSAPSLTALSPSNAAISYSQSSEAGNITGQLTCSTTATSSSRTSGNPYPISDCGGLLDPGYQIYYDYDDSGYTVTPYTTELSWTTPSDITYGTALSGTQLDASAPGPFGEIAGSFSYSPVSGTVLDAGQNQALGVNFTPTDGGDYTDASKTVYINVEKAPLKITADDKSVTYGGTMPALTFTGSGFVNGDNASSLTTQPTCSTTAISDGGQDTSPAGSYQISCSGASSSNYTISYANGTLTVTLAAVKLVYESPTSVKRNGSGEVTATFKAKIEVASNAAPIAGRPVKITFGGASCSAVSTVSGIVSCKIRNAKPRTGKRTVKLHFSGDARGAYHDYAAANGSGKVKVKN